MLPTVPQPRAAQKSLPYPNGGVSHPGMLARRRVLLSHRVCAPADAAYVELQAPRHPELLPRRHQDDRGPAREPFGHHQVAPEGAYSKVPVWSSRDRWLAIEVPVVLAEARRRRGGRLCAPRDDGTPGAPVSDRLLRRYLTVRSAYADTKGRRCIVRPDTIASVLQVDVRTVQNLQAVARHVGLERVIETGRMLTYGEKMKLWWDAIRAGQPPSRQRGLSTEVAFTNPLVRQRNVWITTPDRVTVSWRKHTHLITTHLKRVAAASGHDGAASPRRPPKVSPHWHPAARCLAREVLDALPWLGSEGLARLLPCLRRFVTCPDPWSGAQLVDAIDDRRTRLAFGGKTRSIRHLDPARIRTRPVVLLAALVKDLDPVDDHPGTTPPAPAETSLPVAPVPVCSCAHEQCRLVWISSTEIAELPGPARAVQRMCRDDEHGVPYPCPHCSPGCHPADFATTVIDNDDAGAVAYDPDDLLREPPF